MPKKQCIYCGDTVTRQNKSFEHTVPQWLLNYLQVKDRQLHLSDVSRRNELVREVKHAPDTLGRNICQDCNHKWLSAIDNSCVDDVKHLSQHGAFTGKPALEDSIKRKLTFSTFVYKICLNFISTSEFSNNYTDLYQHFFERRIPAEGTVFFWSAYSIPSPLSVSHSNNWLVDPMTVAKMGNDEVFPSPEMFKFYVQFQNASIVIVNTGSKRFGIAYDPNIIKPTFVIGETGLVEQKMDLLPPESIHQDNPITRVLDSISIHI